VCLSEASVPVGSPAGVVRGGYATPTRAGGRDGKRGKGTNETNRAPRPRGHQATRAHALMLLLGAPSSWLLFVSFFIKKSPRPAAFAHSFFHLDQPACSFRDHHLAPVANSWLRTCSGGAISPSPVGLARAILLIPARLLGWRNWDGLAT
jgi:hypothetical protein